MLAQGKEVAAFEEDVAKLVGRRYGVAVSSGTAALHLALIALGLEKGHRVAIPSYACAALVQPLLWQKAEPILCDIGRDYCLDVEGLPRACDGIVVAHLFGATGQIPDGTHVIEDIAQSMGGNTGRATSVAVTSFYATKLCTTGEGGMVLCDDEGIAACIRDLRDYDNRDTFKTRYAYKMSDMQAALGRVQVQRLPEFISRRQEIAARYNEAFSELSLALPLADGHVYFRYVVASEQRDALESHLQNEGIDAKRPVHHPAHHDLGGHYPVSEDAHKKCLSLPIYPAMVSQEVEDVIQSVLTFHD
jgi:perosamine synthetase